MALSCYGQIDGTSLRADLLDCFVLILSQAHHAFLVTFGVLEQGLEIYDIFVVVQIKLCDSSLQGRVPHAMVDEDLVSDPHDLDEGKELNLLRFTVRLDIHLSNLIVGFKILLELFDVN